MRVKQAAILGVSFDFGQTLASLDCSYLAQKLSRFAREQAALRDVEVSETALEAALADAWNAYDRAVRVDRQGHPWKLFMKTLLSGAGVAASDSLGTVVDLLWDDQPHNNLWRKPIPGMIELARSLKSRGLRVGVLTNSEGRASELIDELGWGGIFDVVVDSGRVQVEKPDPRIFELLSQGIGLPRERIVHLGDSLGADVLGARAAGMHALWFRPDALGPALPADADEPYCRNAEEVERALATLGVPPAP